MQERKLPPDLAVMVQEAKHPEHGFFGPGSISWRLNREQVLFLGGPRALLLQLAHPHVAQGVSEHSSFREDPFGRSRRTFRTVFQVLYGSVDTAVEAALRTRNIHTTVKGELPVTTGSHAAGSHYHANRADLLLWVHATLVDSAVAMYETFLKPLSPTDLATYYGESKIFARLFGVPEKVIPPTYGDFQDYMKSQIENVLAVSPVAGEMCHELLKGPLPLRPLAPASYLLAGATLPKNLRDAYGIPWNGATRFAFRQLKNSMEYALPRMPSLLRYQPAYRKAMRRTRSAILAG
jgi:uncharacterized protein (DUF2236 family)